MPKLHHFIICNAPASQLYKITRESSVWPDLFPPCLSVELIESGENHEVIQIAAQANDTEMSWKSKRTFYDEFNGVDFEQIDPSPLVSSMKGQWRSHAINDSQSILTIEHTFIVKEDITDLVENVTTTKEAEVFMCKTVRENSLRELVAIKGIVENPSSLEEENKFSFETKQVLPFKSDDIFKILVDVNSWPHILPHCNSVDLLYDDGVNQEFIMEVNTPNGLEQIRSIRNVNHEANVISYFQPTPPPIIMHHTGTWTLTDNGGGTNIISQHTIALNHEQCLSHFKDNDFTNHFQIIRAAIENASLTTMKSCASVLTKRSQ